MITSRPTLRPFATPLMIAGLACSGAPVGPEQDPQGVTVAVSPASVALAPAAQQAFLAVVTGAIDQKVTWEVIEGAAGGAVTSNGSYTAPATTGTYHVTATSRADSTKSATASIAVTSVAACSSQAGQLFPPGAPWNTPIDSAGLDSESDAIIQYLAANHTASARFSITYDFNILYADATTPHRSFSKTGDFFSPDCDPAPVPVPPGGRLESESSYACASNGDCHLTVIDRSACRLYEMWRANIAGGTASGTFSGGCLAIWDLSKVPPPTGRGDYCTSADAAGLPILPLVFTADEVASGNIDHAIRFILPNELIRAHVYVRPGTHSTGATSGPASAPPYSARLRLKASKDVSGLSTGAQVVARALKKYGMFLADGGNVTFTAATDDLTAHKWSDVQMDANSLKGLSWNDFEVVSLGSRIDDRTGSCERSPITQ